MTGVGRISIWMLLVCCGVGVLVGGVGAEATTAIATPPTADGTVGETSDQTEALDTTEDDESATEDGDRPLAEAGLDQWVDQHATVYLDAGGSHAPAGDIDSYEWSLERPNGTTTTPACETCEQTSFVAAQNGTYAVTVTVTDTAGQTDSDTMYVHVAERDPPEATLDGPTELNRSEPGEFDLTAEAGSYPLQSLQWLINDHPHDGQFLDGVDRFTEQKELAFDTEGRHTLSVDVIDESGFLATATHHVDVGNFSHFTVTITNATTPVAADQNGTITARIENEGNRPDEQLIALETATGLPQDTTPVGLAPGEATEETFSWEGCFDPGDHPLAVTSDDDADTATVTVTDGSCQAGVLAVDIVDAPTTVVAGDPVDVTASVTEIQGVDTTQEIGLASIHDAWVDTADVSLTGGSERELDLRWQTDTSDAGVGNLTVASEDDDASQELVVLEPPYFEVDIEDVQGPTETNPDLTVEATITNTGEAADTQDIRLTLDDGAELARERGLHLDGGDSETVALTWGDARDSPGTHTLVVASDDDHDRTIVDIESPETTDSYYTGRFVSAPNEIEQGETIAPAVRVTDYTITFASPAQRTATDYDTVQVWEPAPASSKYSINDDHTDIVTSTVTGSIRAQDDAPAGDSVTVCVRGHQDDPGGTYSAGTSQWNGPGWDRFGLGGENDCTTVEIGEADDDNPIR